MSGEKTESGTCPSEPSISVRTSLTKPQSERKCLISNHRCQWCEAPIAPGLREILEYRYEGTGFNPGPSCTHCAEAGHLNEMADGHGVTPVRPDREHIGAPRGLSYDEKIDLMRKW